MPKGFYIQLQSYLHNHVCCYIIHKKEMEPAQKPTNRRMENENVAHISSGILLNHKEKYNYEICKKIDASTKNHIKVR